MKKKLLVMMLAGMMAFSVTACGGSDSSDSAETETTSDEAADSADSDSADSDSADSDSADSDSSDSYSVDSDSADSSDFTLGDVTSDMVDAALYTVDEDNAEVVLMLFTAPDGTAMCAIANLNEDGTGDVVCGAYEAATETDEDGIDWTYLVFEDVYEGGEISVGFVEDEDESYIVTPDGSTYASQRLDNEEAITYMGTALGLMQ